MATPASYPQVQAPIVNNPAFWERLSIDGYGTGTDTLFYAFYYQQVNRLLSLSLSLSLSLLQHNHMVSSLPHVKFRAEHLPTISGCKGAEEAILEIPQKI